MKRIQRLTALLLVLAMTLCAATAMAATLLPEGPKDQPAPGQPLHATVGQYDEIYDTFTVILYDVDRFTKEDVAALQAGDILVAGGCLNVITEISALDGSPLLLCEDGEEILFIQAEEENEVIAQSAINDRIFMHAVAILHLPMAENVTLTDSSDPEPDAQPIVTVGQEAIMAVKNEKEETSIGFDYCNTTITLNERMEIEDIQVVYDAAQ